MWQAKPGTGGNKNNIFDTLCLGLNLTPKHVYKWFFPHLELSEGIPRNDEELRLAEGDLVRVLCEEGEDDCAGEGALVDGRRVVPLREGRRVVVGVHHRHADLFDDSVYEGFDDLSQ